MVWMKHVHNFSKNSFSKSLLKKQLFSTLHKPCAKYTSFVTQWINVSLVDDLFSMANEILNSIVVAIALENQIVLY